MPLGLAIFVYGVFSAAAGYGGHRIGRRFAAARLAGARLASRRGAWPVVGLAGGVVGVLLVNAVLLADHPVWARVLPIENVWLFSNPALPGAAFLAGLVWHHVGEPASRAGRKGVLPAVVQRLVVAGVLVALGFSRSVSPAFKGRPMLGPDRWSGETCRQSTRSTCAPAAAASALAAVGVRTTEAALARDALSSEAGTANLTLFRALRRATEGRGVEVTAYRGRAEALPVPAVVVLAPARVATTIVPMGGRHAVAVLRREGDRLVVADPYAGTQHWTVGQLESVWTGSAFVLTVRSGTGGTP